MQIYHRNGRDIFDSDPKLQEILGEVHAARTRLLCRCRRDVDLPLYTARRHDRYVLARMPGTGPAHAPGCDHFEAPDSLTGLGQVRDSAVIDDPDTGEARLKLAFALKRGLARSSPGALTSEKPSLKSNGQRLTMRGLLHILWDRAELTHWHPRMADKRNWWIVRRALLGAIEHCSAKGSALSGQVYIPEEYRAKDRSDIVARRHASLAPARASTDNMMIVIGSLDSIGPSPHGEMIKLHGAHDWPLFLDSDMVRRFHRRFAPDLALWQATGDAGHLILGASFAMKRSGLAEIIEVALMPVTREWIPYESLDEREVVRAAIDQSRHFIKGMRVDLGPDEPIASMMLTDTAPLATAVHLHGASPDQALDQPREALLAIEGVAHSLWAPGLDLPAPRRRGPPAPPSPL